MRTKLALLGLLSGVVMLACNADGTTEPAPAEEAPVTWKVAKSSRFGTTTFLAPTKRLHGPQVIPVPLVKDDTAVMHATLGFLDAHRSTLKMRAPSKELRVVKTERDAIAMTHVRFDQVERGIPVTGASMIVHYDQDGRVTSTNGTYVPDLDQLDIVPSVSSERAVAIAAEDGTVEGSPKLVFSTTGPKNAALAWEVTAGHWIVTIDAQNGDVLGRLDMLQALKGSGTGISGKKRNLEVEQSTQNPGTFELKDTTRATAIWTFDNKNSFKLEDTTIFTSTSATAWDTTNAVGKGAAVDATANMGIVVDYFKKVHGRNGMDDKNMRIDLAIHHGDGYDNAQYFGNGTSTMLYGDGKETFKQLAGALDVAAHEFSHGFTAFTSKLIYERQSGALNEAISDIFGAVVEHTIAPDEKLNWQIGEGTLLNSELPLRDMSNPGAVKQAQPSHMSEYVVTGQDAQGVHINSGIINKAAHLMTVGGTHPVSKVAVPAPGIGWDKLALVWYRANAVYLTQLSDFGAAAKATLQAATDLKLSQAEVDTIDCAWKAVGVVQGKCVAIAGAGAGPDEATGEPTEKKEETGDADEPEIGEDADDKAGASKAEPGTTRVASQGGCSMTTTTTPTSSVLSLLAPLAIAFLARRRRAR